MLKTNVHPTTIDGVKRLASEFRKERGIKYAAALDLSARAANFENYQHARRALRHKDDKSPTPYVLLTYYWSDKKLNYLCGRETLRIDLSKPILEQFSRFDLRHVRGFSGLRMVADDHFVSDLIAPSQDYAREMLCMAERSLRFMEHTGLRPSTEANKPDMRPTGQVKLPGMDHTTSWKDPLNGVHYLVIEPYSPDGYEAEREKWAAKYGWSILKSDWPGMYFPYECALYLATDERGAPSAETIMQKVNIIPAPRVSSQWEGESVNSWDPFLSPLAVTKQDVRRAKCKGMVYPNASRTTVPYNYSRGTSRRRPIGGLGINGHCEAGKIIKACLSSGFLNWAANRRMESLRCDLEDWLSSEIDRAQLDDSEFFEVYYRSTSADNEYRKAIVCAEDVVSSLEDLGRRLRDAYSDSAPLRKQLGKIQMAIVITQRSALQSTK